MDPIPIKQDIVDILQRLFKQDNEFTYDDDQDKTKVIIADIYGVDRKNTEQYPAILVAREAMKYGKVGIGDFAGSTWSAKLAAQPNDSYGCFVNGGIVCNCLSYEGIEAERIATKVAAFFEMTKREIGKHLKIQIGDVSMGGEVELKNWPPGLIAVPVSFNYTYGVTWKITDLDTIIRGATLTVNPV